MDNLFRVVTFFLLCMVSGSIAFGQEVPILDYQINDWGQVQLTINSTSDQYYILKVKIDENSDEQIDASMIFGEAGTTIITESLSARPLSFYQVLGYPVATPVDTDEDGTDDITEYQNIPVSNPLNAATPIDVEDGLTMIDSFVNFNKLSATKDFVQYSEFLNGKVFVKFIIVDFHTDHPKTYFVNTSRHELHADFAEAVNIDNLGDEIRKGQIIFHPTTIANNGNLGTFVFNYSNGHGKEFDRRANNARNSGGLICLS